MVFELFCATMIALLLGALITFGGYRLFLALLPIWGFFFGFALGAETLQLIFGEAFLATVTSWIVGFIVGAIFGLLAYLFYTVAVGLIAGSVGYALGAGFMNLIGVEFGFLVWIVGIVVGAVAILVTFWFALQKYAIIIATAVGGAGMVVITLMFGYVGLTLAKLVDNPVQFALDDSPLWALFYLLLAAAGIAVQIATTRGFEVAAYDSRI
jgi:hypothetical protein